MQRHHQHEPTPGRIQPSCTGKAAFPTHELASAAAARMRQRKNGKHGTAQPYHCFICKRYHVGGKAPVYRVQGDAAFKRRRAALREDDGV